MLTEPICSVIPRMAVPTIIAFLINAIYSLADTYFVSSLGTNATAAVSVTGPGGEGALQDKSQVLEILKQSK